MKNFILVIALIFFAFTTYAQNNCQPYLPSNKGDVWEISSYSAKNKLTGKTSYEMLDKVVQGNEIVYKVKTVSYDKKGKEVFENTFEARCKDGSFEFDMEIFIDGNMMKAYDNMELDVNGSSLEMPSSKNQIGTNLKDGSLDMKIGSDGAMPIKMSIFLTNRKIEAKEKMTTEAGTFDCIVMSQNIKTKMIVNIETNTKEWYAENVGLVRSESFNKKGKLMGYSVLTKFTN